MSALVWVGALWLVVYAVKYSSRPSSSLPLSQNRRPVTKVTVRRLDVRLKTEAFNVYHDKLSAWLSSKRILRRILSKSYDLGSLLGVVSMLVAYGLLVLTALSLSSEILLARRGHGTITKRGLDQDAPPTSSLPRINPIIPGLTVPLSHLPLILVALAISQIVHEFGHAITAAIHRIQMLSCGVAFTFVLPSAFVTLPAARLDKLPPRDRLQIVSGGCFHNFILFCLLFSAAWSSIASLPTWVLFQDVSSQGKLVIDVDSDSPLSKYLPVGTLVTKMDDVPMVSASSDDPWSLYLHSPDLGPIRGWCTDDPLLDRALAPGCPNVNSSYACFISKLDEPAEYELDPIHIFTNNSQRCQSSLDCSSSTSCVEPRPDQQLVRISTVTNHGSASVEDMLVWKGPKEEIWEQVHVGHLRPRFYFVPSKLPEIASTFFEYMKIANISLYLVNMLPITALDGHQLLASLFQLLFGHVSVNSDSIDLEAITVRSNREGRIQRAFRTCLGYFTLLLVGLCVLLGTVRWTME